MLVERKSYGCTPKRYGEIRKSIDDEFRHFGLRKKLWFAWDRNKIIPEWPCCYAVYFHGKLLYVGQTENFRYRFSAQCAKGILQNVDLVNVAIKLKLPRRFGDWLSDEYRLIKRLRPQLNRFAVSSKF